MSESKARGAGLAELRVAQAGIENLLEFTPVHHFVHIKRYPIKEHLTAGGIELPGIAKDKMLVFEVVAVGPGFLDPQTGKRMPMSVKPGDLCLVDANQVVEVSYCAQPVAIVPETGIYGTIVFPEQTPKAVGNA